MVAGRAHLTLTSPHVTDEDGNRTHVIIPNDQFEKLLDDLEDVWCLRALERAKAEPGEAMDAEEFFTQLDKERGWDTR